MEDSHMPLLLRNSQVESIWEGTTNVLAHDVWRPIRKHPQALNIFTEEILRKITPKNNENQRLNSVVESVKASLNKIREFVTLETTKKGKDGDVTELVMREFALTMAKTYIASLMVEFYTETRDTLDLEVAARFIQTGIYLVPSYESIEGLWKANKQLGLDTDPSTGKPRGVGDVDSRGITRAKY